MINLYCSEPERIPGRGEPCLLLNQERNTGHRLVTYSSRSQKWRMVRFSVLRIRDVDPGSWFFSILYPTTKQKRNITCLPCFCSYKFHKIKYNFIFEQVQKKDWANWQRIVLFTPKIVTKLSEVWVGDPGSGKKPISDPGSRRSKSPGSSIRNTGDLLRISLVI